MFEKKEPFNWKSPVIILTGIVVLSGGIYLGAKTRDVDDKEVNSEHDTQQQQQTKEVKKEVKEVFGLNKDCEIWVHKKNEDGSDSGKSPMMIGTIDKVLLDKSKEEIEAYLGDKYPERQVETIDKFKIILTETLAENDPSRSNKYSLEPIEDFIGLYRYDSNGNKELIEKTEIKIDTLPSAAQNEIQSGVIINSEDEAYTKLEDFGS